MSNRFDMELLKFTETSDNGGLGDRDARSLVSTHIRIFDVLKSRFVADNNLTTPPTLVNGDAYIVPASATGDWSGWDKDIAIAIDGAWVRVTAVKGMLFFVSDAGAWRKFNGANWMVASV